MSYRGNGILPARLRSVGLDAGVIRTLAQHTHHITLAKGQTLCPACENMGLALVCQGTLIRQVGFHDGTVSSTELLFSDQFLFSGGTTSGADHNVCFRALEFTEIEWLGMDIIYQLCRENNGFLERYLEKKHRYSRMVEDHLLLRTILSKKEHLMITLAMIFSAKLRRNENAIKITIEELCTVTGSTRQYCSKVITELCQNGILINHYGSLELLDYSALKAQLGSDARRHYELFRAKPV
ncbi:putative transcriptional regulator, Crp/Fnr family [Ferrimonas balearica DSM 9799]|uniref:Putative transcriptional regulator, Crp/Fnr family n=1 Tax=Ferrimonas balearica (strain DSM 9799 / CCM 4581 / KCTC 23876 / PAT) TaxID=550540 RepID=E1SPJ7_FERBD|nr:Crp/Fnr family transcriptional regulator [Ferrimonas balearica]ADN77814.1 putative transcriptional regulator, Crp/Fnr family [Ferrimonas balearica DSM 9799]MBW3140819.1 Crp/Fnr family transcriptional regulator [Ferrimonas balearica]MBW3165978.1 Crp/Fnr family transcriptional regulator [Ferrimonas balearica]MBY5981888.1 Crp/Fnr family transcriptional regulator [Ferrimonas balearica]MBY6108156.1 Crp/Fnr family transcriptional regulator [Ferrimonas balearica]